MRTPNILGLNSARGNRGVTKFMAKTAPKQANVQVKIWLNSFLSMDKSKLTVLNRAASVKPTTRMVIAPLAKTPASVPMKTVPYKKIRLAVTMSKLLIQSKRTIQP